MVVLAVFRVLVVLVVLETLRHHAMAESVLILENLLYFADFRVFFRGFLTVSKMCCLDQASFASLSGWLAMIFSVFSEIYHFLDTTF